MRKSLLFLLILLGVATAQTPSPMPAAAGGQAAILFVQASGALDAAAQAQWEPQALVALRPQAGASFEASSAMFTTSPLSEADRNALLAYPEVLLASSRAPSMLNTRYLILAHIGGENKHHRLEADLVDVEHNERYHIPSVEAGKDDQLMQRLADSFRKRLDRVTQRSAGGVLGNSESKLYHLPNVEHTDKSKLRAFKDERAARDAGYQPCPICFPEENKALKMDEDEGSLGEIMSQLMRFEYPITRYPDEPKVEGIAHRLAEASHVETDLRFKTINTDDIFSVSYTGGEVYFSTGLQKILETPDETAALIAHEMAHVERDHFLQLFREAFEQYGPPSIVRFERPNAYADFLIRLHRRLMHDGFPQPMEQEADDYAIQYMLRAGYRTEVYAQTLHKIQEAAEAHHFRKTAWTRVHPMPAERVARLATLPDQLKAVMDLSKTVAQFDPGAAVAMQNHAVAMAATLPAAKQFSTVLQGTEGTAPYPSVRGEPVPRN